MQRERLGFDALTGDRRGDEFFSEFRGFACCDHPPHDVTTKNIDDHIQLVVLATFGATKFCDVRRPDMIRSRHEKFRFFLRGMGTLTAAFTVLANTRQDPVHRADTAIILALIEERSPKLCGREITIRFTPQNIEDDVAFANGQCVRGLAYLAWCWWAVHDRLLTPVMCRTRPAQQTACTRG